MPIVASREERRWRQSVVEQLDDNAMTMSAARRDHLLCPHVFGADLGEHHRARPVQSAAKMTMSTEDVGVVDA
jgi:hypothetical protein